MGILTTAKHATFQGPTRLALHSVEGFGKTTLASFFPAPLFVCGERGFPRDLGHAPAYVEPKSWADVRNLVHELTTTEHAYESLVFDTMDWIEPLIWKYVCERDTNRKTEMNPKGNTLEHIEDYGFGKGYLASMSEMRDLLSALDNLQTKRGVHVVILMHSHVKTFNNPAGDNFDRWQPKMHERCSRLVVEWSENVFFGYFEITTAKEDPKDKKAKGASTGRRILGTRHNAMYDAKNRFNLPDTIELQDPRALIPYLLGKHIKGPEHANAATPAGKLTKPPQSEPEKDDGKEPPRNAAYQTEKKQAKSEEKPASFDETQKKIEQKLQETQPEMSEEAKAVALMLDAVEEHCGTKARNTVEKWVASADDKAKLDWCFSEAQKLVTAAKSKSKAPVATA